MGKKKKNRKKRKTKGSHSGQRKNTQNDTPQQEPAPTHAKTSNDDEVDAKSSVAKPTKTSETNDANATEQPTETTSETARQRWFRLGWQIGLFALIYFGMMAWMNRALLPTGGKAPSFALKTLQGEQHTLAQYKGKRVILHFWATWCGACKMNMPIMRTIAGQYKKDPILLSVVLDGHRRKEIRRIVKDKGINYPVLIANSALARRYRVQRYPTTYFIDKKGRIASKDSGLITPIGFWWRSIWLWLTGHTT